MNNWNRGGFNRGRGRRTFRGAPCGHYGGRGGGPGPYRGRSGHLPLRADQPWRKFYTVPAKRVSEADIGITEFVSDHEGFHGVIKSRFSDFQVAEINENGEIAKLTCLDPPPPPVDEEEVDQDEDLLLNKYNVELLPMETWDKINKLVLSDETCTDKVEIDVTGMTKEERTKIHNGVKKAFGESVVGSTVAVEDKKFVCFQKYRRGVRVDNRVKWLYPGEYVHFIVYKENCDTMDAAAKIAERLRNNMKPSMLGYAGTKDRRARTSQWFSVRRVDPKKLQAACRGMRELQLGNYSFSGRQLKLGMLRGNRFRIALRNVSAEDAQVFAACELLQTRGFLNYYGTQRFGTRKDMPTYRIGLKLLQANYREAIECILDDREGPLQFALRVFAEWGAGEAFRVLPRQANSSVEGRLLKALARAPNDLLGALAKMGRNSRLLYLHSYQSLIWNRCVSRRVSTLGLQPALGDLVLADHTDKLDELNDSDSDDNEEEDDGKASKEAKESPEASRAMRKEMPKPKVPVKVVTQEDLDSGTYTMFDIVMPLPGYNVDYPPNLKDYYEELLAKDDLKLDMKHKQKSYSLSGAYRFVVARPSDVQFECVRYDDPFGDLLLSDLDQLSDDQAQRHAIVVGRKKRPDAAPSGQFKALLLSMSLPASCYATMALRELLKVDTTGDFQALHNNYHQVKTPTSQSSSTTANPTETSTEEEKEVKSENENENGNEEETETEKRKLENENEGESEVVAKKVKQDGD